MEGNMDYDELLIPRGWMPLAFGMWRLYAISGVVLVMIVLLMVIYVITNVL